MTFWELLDNPTCDTCGTILVEIDDATFYCSRCKDLLTLCGMHGVCEGIAHNGPYIYIGGKLEETGNLADGYCKTCGEGWESA